VSTVDTVLIIIVCCVLAALLGACGALAFEAIHRRGERSRFIAEVTPLREALDELGDRFEHFYKRETKRARDAAGGNRTAEVETPGPLPTRAERLQELRHRLRRRSLPQEPGSRAG
jgi:hypothetical protein